MKTILLSQKIHPSAMAMLYGKYNVLLPAEPGQAAFEALLPQADALILRTNLKLTAKALSTAPNLRIICRTGVGLDNVPLEEARKRGILVTTTPLANSISVAEHTVALIAALAKYLPTYDRETRKGNWNIRMSDLPFEIYGKTVGVVGMGRIGTLVAEILHNGFKAHIIGYGPSVDPRAFPEYRITKNLEELFANSDIITMHCPSTEKTRGMVDGALLSRAKPGVLFINCARGDVVVEADLLAALQSGQVAAAGLDVLTTEPADLASPLLYLENVLLTPHSAALTKEAYLRMSVTAVEQANAFFQGNQPDFIVK